MDQLPQLSYKPSKELMGVPIAETSIIGNLGGNYSSVKISPLILKVALLINF